MATVCCAVPSLCRVRVFATPWTVACQSPLSVRILQARILEWVATPSSRGSSQLRDWTQVSLTVGRLFTVWAARECSLWFTFYKIRILYKVFCNFCFTHNNLSFYVSKDRFTSLFLIISLYWCSRIIKKSFPKFWAVKSFPVFHQKLPSAIRSGQTGGSEHGFWSPAPRTDPLWPGVSCKPLHTSMSSCKAGTITETTS